MYLSRRFSYSATVLQDSPVGFWMLDETSGTSAADASGNARNGTYTNTPTLNQASLLANGQGASVLFDGSTEYVNIAHNAAFAPTTALSVEAVFNCTQAGYNCIASKRQAGGWAIDVGDGNLRGQVRVGGAYLTVSPSGDYKNQPYHVVLTYTGRYGYLYVNGALAATADYGSSASIEYSASNNVMIGCDPGTGTTPDGSLPYYFGGKIAMVAVYNTALPATRIAAHYDAARFDGALFATMPGLSPVTVARLGL